MTPARWSELEPLIDAALDLAVEHRRALFDDVAARDPALAADLERLVNHGDRGDSLFEAAAAERFALLSDEDDEPRRFADMRDELQVSLGSSYELERELRGGGMSRVLVAVERSLGRRVVIKLLAPRLATGLSAERFEREITIAASLQQANIVPLLSAGRAGDVPYYTMPFVEGRSLRDRLTREGALPIPDAVNVLRDMARALAYAHAHGVVHRDIKPGNVLLSGGAAVITDFGIAKAVSAARQTMGVETTQGGVTLGTPAYMSPEQAAGDSNVDHRADIYSLGGVAYELLTGRAPFAGRPLQEVIAAHIGEVPARVEVEHPEIPPALALLVMQCLAKRPADRPQSGDEVLRALQAIGTNGEVVMAPAVRAGRNRGVMMKLAIAAVLLLTVGAWFVLRPAAGDALNTRRVVVAPFVNLTGDSTLNVLGPWIAEGVTRGLEQLDSIDVVSTNAGLSRADGGLRTLASVDAARAVGDETRAGRVVAGAYFRDGDTLRLQARIIETRGGRVQHVFDPVSGPMSSRSDVIERLRDNVATALQASAVRTTVGSMGHLPNLAAYQEFITAFELGIDGPKAEPYLVKAIRLDSTFTLALYWLAVGFQGEGRWKAADSVVAIMRARSDRFSPVERELFASADAFTHSDYQADLVASRQLLKRDSTEINVGGVAFDALVVNRPREALEALRTAAASRFDEPGDWGHWNKMAIAYHMMARYKEEQAVATTGRSRLRGPFGQSFMLDRQLEALAARGDTMALRQKADSFAVAWNTAMRNNRLVQFRVSNDPAQLYRFVALELMAHGRTAEATRYVNKGLAWQARQPAVEQATDVLQTSLAELLVLAGKPDSARAIWARLAVHDTLYTGARIQLAIVSAWRSDTATARQTMRVLDSLAARPYSFGRPLVQEAGIAAALGDKDGAVGLLQRALDAGAIFDQRWHSAAEFRSLQGFGAFRTLLAPKG